MSLSLTKNLWIIDYQLGILDFFLVSFLGRYQRKCLTMEYLILLPHFLRFKVMSFLRLLPFRLYFVPYFFLLPLSIV